MQEGTVQFNDFYGTGEETGVTWSFFRWKIIIIQVPLRAVLPISNGE